MIEDGATLDPARPHEPEPGCRLEAAALFARGEHEQALACIDDAITRWRVSIETFRLRERILRAMPLLGAVHPHLELMAREGTLPDDLRALLISSSLDLGLFETAREHLEASLSARPSVEAHLDLARACLSARRPDDAVRVLDRALAMHPTSDERVRIARRMLHAGELGRARAIVIETLRSSPESQAARIELSWLCLWQGDPRRATRLAAEVRDGAEASRLRGAIAFVTGRHDEARAAADRALAADPSDAEARTIRAAASWRLGLPGDALADAQRATFTKHGWSYAARLVELVARTRIAEQAPPPELREMLDALGPIVPAIEGLSYEGTIRPETVLPALDAVLDRLSGNFTSMLTFTTTNPRGWLACTPLPPPRIACLRVFDTINARPVPSVIAALHALHASYPDSAYVHTHAAELHLWFGDYAACERECRAALAITETGPSRWAWVGLGASLLFRDRADEALEVFARAETLMVPGAPLLAYRGEALRVVGRLDDARADLSRALASTPARVSAWLNLGLMAHARGREAEVRAIHGELDAKLPVLMRDLVRDLGHAPSTPDAMAAVFAHGLAAMAGNRSSNRITYQLRDGRMRVAEGKPLDVVSE